MSTPLSQKTAHFLSLPESGVIAVLNLLEEGATIPFIARYRKDRTGALDEVQIQQIKDTATGIQEFEDRKHFIVTTITEQGKMTAEIQRQLEKVTTLHELEDVYLPFKPKRKTKAQKAREQGLEPLSDWLLTQSSGDVSAMASRYITDEVPDDAAALKGARAILSEVMNEDTGLRAALRRLFEQKAMVRSTVVPEKEAEGKKFHDYFDYQEQIRKIPSHRMLAILRGFTEGILRMVIEPDEADAIMLIRQKYMKNNTPAAAEVEKAIRDSYKRLLQPALESEFRLALKAKSDEDAINVFAENLRQLLLSAPLGRKRIIAIDPGYRTGCKVVVLDEYGELLHNDLIYIHEKGGRLEAAQKTIGRLIEKYQPEAFAIGDGTAGRETEQFIKKLQTGRSVFLVNEDGASIYSASETAREEFPDEDITVRGAVSIGRRLIDPLAELVKIEPKSIGVGQYQHDVNQARLKEKLDQTVVHCVNAVGVDLNTAGKHLLQYVSGIGPALAANIVAHRKQHGAFPNRTALLSVDRLGQKAFEQCAGFLRIRSGDEPLDASGVHPEAYSIVRKMASDRKTSVSDLIGNTTLIQKIKPEQYFSDTTGRHTIEDLIKELRKPGLDPRSMAQTFEFAQIFSIDDLSTGMIVPGKVTNITRFGAFVDIGIKQDGLIHISEITHRYISDPAEVLRLHEHVKVKIIDIDRTRNRISLSLRQAQAPNDNRPFHGKKRNETASRKEAGIEAALSALKKKFS